VAGLLNVVRGWAVYCITTTETPRELTSRRRAMDKVWLVRPCADPALVVAVTDSERAD
jgi:hypothetical protein